MKFTPYHDKIVIKPIEKKNIIQTESGKLQERGEVIAVGVDVDFVKVGDHLFFDSWGCSKTAPNDEGEEYYLVSDVPSVIYGKEERM